jgi:hypothetical protein
MLRSSALFLLVLAAAGWATAGTPFRGDQALFADSARRVCHGAVLYRDVWDVTNPGIFAFYATAGTLFGWTEDGIHLAEWLWWSAFAVCVARASQLRFALATLPLAPALLLAGEFFLTAGADPSHLSKVEGLVGFPLFLAAWRAGAAFGRGSLLFAGCCGGAVLLFKFAFAPLLLALWLPALVYPRRPIRDWLILGGGTALPVLAAAAYFAFHGALATAIETLFIAPRQMVAAAEPAEFNRLAASVRWFAEVGTGTLAVAVFAAWSALRERRDALVLGYLAVLPAAVAVILVQRWSWWSYHFVLLQTSVGVLAAYCWPAAVGVVRGWGSPRQLAPLSLGLAVSFLPDFGHGFMAYNRLIGHRCGLFAADRDAARRESGRAYQLADLETDWLAEPDAKAGPIFVAGDPLFHWRSGRPAATAHHGWSLELYAPPQWEALHRELIAAKPVYVYVSKDDGYDRTIAERGRAIADWLAGEYRVCRNSVRGVWYERKP